MADGNLKREHRPADGDIVDRLGVEWAEARAEILRLRGELALCRRILPAHIERIMYETSG
jgi:hypothetical protein